MSLLPDTDWAYDSADIGSIGKTVEKYKIEQRTEIQEIFRTCLKRNKC